MALIAPRFRPLRDKVDVIVRDPTDMSKETTLQVRGQSSYKIRTDVYLDRRLVMRVRRTDVLSAYILIRPLEWEVEVAQGLDLSLVCPRKSLQKLQHLVTSSF